MPGARWWEGAWAYRYPAKVSRQLQLRLEKLPAEIQAISWKAQGRLCKRYRQLSYLPVRALSRIVRAKFRDQIATRGLLGDIPPEVWAMEWNVHCQPAGDGSEALQYLAPYVFKVAIGERRILAVDAHHVCFRYQKPHSHRVRTMTLPIMEFMRRFLQHVLPRGFTKVRYYGFLSPSASVPLPDVKARIEMASGFALVAPDTINEPLAALHCRHCGGALRFSRLLLPGDSAIAWLASLGPRAGEPFALSAVPAGP